MISNKTKGYFLGSISAASYGMNPLFTLPLYAAGMCVDSVLFYRYSLAALMMGVLMKIQKQSFSLRMIDGLLLCVMGLLFSTSSLFLFMSYKYMDAGIASTILFIYPVLVAIIMSLFFNERISRINLFAIILSFLGIVLLCRPATGQTLNLTGVGYVFLSALSYAISIVGVNRTSLRTIPSVKLTFYALLFGLSIYVVRLNFCMELQVVPEPYFWIHVILLALFPTIISLITMTKSIHYIGSTPTAILGALEPVTAMFFGVWIFGEQLTSRILVGMLLVIVAVSLIIGGDLILKAFHAGVIRRKKCVRLE